MAGGQGRVKVTAMSCRKPRWHFHLNYAHQLNFLAADNGAERERAERERAEEVKHEKEQEKEKERQMKPKTAACKIRLRLSLSFSLFLSATSSLLLHFKKLCVKAHFTVMAGNGQLLPFGATLRAHCLPGLVWSGSGLVWPGLENTVSEFRFRCALPQSTN